MSRFSGKCDVYDWFGMIACEKDETPFECYKRRKAVIKTRDGSRVLDFKKPSELVPFYPYLMATMSSHDGRDFVVLTEGSYVDTLGTVISAEGYMHYLRELVEEYDRVKAEEDPEYVQAL